MQRVFFSSITLSHIFNGTAYLVAFMHSVLRNFVLLYISIYGDVISFLYGNQRNHH